MRVYVVFDEATGREAGYVGEQIEARGGVIHYIDRLQSPTFDSLTEPDLLYLLGSHLSAHKTDNAELVEAESKLVRDSLAAGVPVLGICYGAQLMARALGGTSYRGAAPEVGWREVETIDPVLCPPGPWAQLHSDVFEAPPTATLLGKSAAGPQSFIDEAHGARAIAWQFHPEVPLARYDRWILEDEGYYQSFGHDTAALRAESVERDATNRANAHALANSALTWLLG